MPLAEGSPPEGTPLAEGLPLIEAIPVHRVNALVEQVIISGLPSDESYQESTIKLVGSHQKDFFFKIMVHPLLKDEKDMVKDINNKRNTKVKGTIVILTDVTRFYELEAMKTDFVTIVSHEFRTPLTSITIGVGMLQEGILGQLNDKGKEIVNAVEEDCERLNKLVNHLLDISRMDDGHIIMETEEVDIYGLIKEGVSPLMLQAQAKGVEIMIDLPPDTPPAEADFNKAVWLVTNLIGNALRYTDMGGRITIGAKCCGNRIFISVTDTGCGIPLEYQEKIFKKHEQVKGDANPGGAGLGLAICQEIVEAHGGRIWVESTEGEGSSFTFTLPLATREAKID